MIVGILIMNEFFCDINKEKNLQKTGVFPRIQAFS